MSDQRLKIAVFIDFDNVEIGVKTTLGLQFDVGAVLEAIKERGEVITKIAYGDWKRAGEYGRTMSQHAVRLVQRVMTPGGDKNGADINLALDALEMAFTHDHINAFVIVGGDSDFITLVEKLKQYDKKVFVVGGRAFTSQVMQKNCTEFIAYENVTGKGGGAQRPERGRPVPASSSLDQSLPLVKRALKVLADREVSPQLGLLKSTLLQLDSSFSERDYGASTFRDFAEKLEKRGLVTLKHSGRTTVVELVEGASLDATAAPAPALPEPGEPFEPATRTEPQQAPVSELSLADGVALVREVLAEATPPPRWPMYLRQMKQFLRTARPEFDERRYGSLQDLLRACQKDGLVRLERDRQGGLRAFAGSIKPSNVPHGWASLGGDGTESDNGASLSSIDGVDSATATEGHVLGASQAQDLPTADEADDDESVGSQPAPGEHDQDEGDDQLAMFGVLKPEDPEPAKAKRPTARRTRKTADTGPAERPKRARKAPATRTPSRRSRS
ncbi:MAG: NYN domain-containing protein [Acidobacteria bacterium]|nr:NYN domain-containing protein [Acidobacteriota bacterium]